ncbi:hypothetical protein [Arthrobacter crystallopoietes]|uniref:TrbL/VirB6 plasmid conjugal transfer protein n=1 Tax=Crystallibacter crystallopoietes TaxID=37928 RepID=A0A1H0XKY9_9MICC|nr:hypothetical protein [Arthrobacter crystallopoietes]SDQ03577.1 hypothetical protein SAMN04489742_0116 [Arthrobacter crystallopoietes]
MQTLSANRTIRLAAVLLVMFLGLGVVFAGPAHAADEVNTTEKLNADHLKRLAGLPEAQRNEIRDRLNHELGKESCADFAFFTSMGGNDCENVAAKAFGTFLTTPEKSLDYDGTKTAPFCAGLSAVGAPMNATAWCVQGAAWQDFSPLAGVALRTALSVIPGGQVVLGTVDTVAFIADAKDGFERFANTVKEEGVTATNEVLNNLLKVATFEIDDAFRNTWAAFAGIGILVMGLMYFKLWKDVSNEEIDMDSARQSLLWYGPLSMILVLFGPALGYVVNGWMTGITESVSFWTSSRVTDFGVAISRFASYESSGAFGPLAAVALFGLLFVSAWAMLGLLAVQPLALYLLGLGLALMIGFMIHAKYRERVGKVGALWLGISLSKPLLLLIMGAVFSYIASRPAFSEEGVDDGMVNATSVFLAAAAMLVLAFSLPLLFKYVPILPSSSTGLGADRQSVAGAAMVAGAGAGISSAIRARRTSQVQSGKSGGGGKPHGGGKAGTQGKPDAGQETSGPGSSGRRSTASRSGGQGQDPQETQTIGELQNGRSGAGGGKAGQTIQAGAKSVGRGSVKVAAGGATAFLLAGREAARQAALRGRQSARSMAPDTDHISGR